MQKVEMLRTYNNEAIKKLATIIAEIAEIAETEGIEGKVMDILEEYL